MKHIRVARLFAPGAHFLKYSCRVYWVVLLSCTGTFVSSCIAYFFLSRLVRYIAYYWNSLYRASSHSRNFVFASKFLSAYRLAYGFEASFRVSVCLRLVYGLSLFRVLSSLNRRVSLWFCSFVIADGLSRDSAIPELTPSLQFKWRCSGREWHGNLNMSGSSRIAFCTHTIAYVHTCFTIASQLRFLSTVFHT